MPTSGTHITIVQRLALDPELQPFLGDPSADDDDPDENKRALAKRMRFANLGAVGPDIFYALADYGGDLQDLENFLIKVGGTFECIAELMEKVNRFISGVESEITFGVIDSLKQTFGLLSGIIKEGLLALIVDAGYNFWPFFEARRQQDRPRTEWYWSDYLHYVSTGRFTRRLLENSNDNPNLRAYALGYLTHYITDVVGHPYVNQVVQGPWRLYWQRHHLVENFIDAYVWDRWHVSRPAPEPPTTEEQPLDTVAVNPNSLGTGAPFTFARLHDLINIGIPSLGDPVDELVQKVCDLINAGLFDIGVAEKTDQSPPDDQDFRDWTELMSRTLREVYANDHPLNLAPERPDGFPTPDDISGAYGTFRLFLKLTTEEKIQEPTFPDIIGDISRSVQKFYDTLRDDLGRIPPPPLPSFDTDFSLDAIWDAIKRAAQWLSDFGEALGKTVFDFLVGVVTISGTVVSEPIKFVLYLLNKWLFTVYRQFRDVLVLAAYHIPFTEELAVDRGASFNTTSLWRSRVDLGLDQYPQEEIAAERAYVDSSYAPFRPPITQRNNRVEQPPVGLTAPYKVHGDVDTGGISPTLPDDFIDTLSGKDDMFLASGPEVETSSSDPRAPHTFASDPRNFGNALANCIKAIAQVRLGFPPPFTLPDYNLDGDRGYAWPCWDVSPQTSPDAPRNPNDPLYPTKVPDPLSPTDARNSDSSGSPPVAHVNAVPLILQDPNVVAPGSFDPTI